MTLRKPDDVGTLRWLTNGIDFKTLIAAGVFVFGASYSLATRVTVIEQDKPETNRRFEETARRLDEQRDQLKDKVDKQTYDMDQRKLSDELTAIRESQGRIEDILMEKHGK